MLRPGRRAVEVPSDRGERRPAAGACAADRGIGVMTWPSQRRWAAVPQRARTPRLERITGWRVNRIMTTENSGLLALAELRAMESNRLAQIEATRVEAARARAAEHEESQRRAAEDAMLTAAAEREAARRALEQRRALELEEQRRVDRIAAQARIDQQERLRAEAARLERQMRAAERASTPRWPYAVIPVLVAVFGFAAVKTWHDSGEAERLAQANAADRSSYEQQMAAVAGRLDALAAKQQRLEQERSELERKLAAAASDAERDAITARVEAIDRELDAAPKPGTTKPTKTKPKDSKAKPPAVKVPTGETPPTRKPIVVGDGTDPLDGL